MIDSASAVFNSCDVESAIIVDCGHSSTQVTPFFQGKIMTNFQRRFNIGGVDISNFLVKLLEENGEQVQLPETPYRYNAKTVAILTSKKKCQHPSII